MRIRGSKFFKRSLHWVRSRLSGGALILGYHRIADAKIDPFSLCVSPGFFAEHLEVLRSCAVPMSLKHLVLALKGGDLPRRAVALTFDDGYSDALYAAKPLLEQYQIPATVFVTSGYLGREFWWDELKRLVMSGSKKENQIVLDTNGHAWRWPVESSRDQEDPEDASRPRLQLLLSLYQFLLSRDLEVREDLFGQLRSDFASAATGGECCRSLTVDEVVQLSQGGHIEIGAHTVNHPVLDSMTLTAQEAEISRSKSMLEEILNCPVSSFSYPNGSLSKQTVRIVRHSGFERACASHSQVALKGTDPFRLPRFWIPDWDGERFSRWLSWWICG